MRSNNLEWTNAMKIVAAILLSFTLTLCASAGEIFVRTDGNDMASGSKDQPLKSLSQALKQAREWRRLNKDEAKDGITIFLGGGEYQLESTLFIRPEDSGSHESPTVICSVDSNNRAVINGGVKVTGWHKGCDDKRIPKHLRKNIWWAEAPTTGNKLVETRQMWVNGKKAVKAMQFGYGVMERMKDFSAKDRSITIPTPQNIEELHSANQLEMMIHQRWAIAILRVKSMTQNGAQTTVTFHEPESSLEFAHPWPQPVIDGELGNSSFCLMNALELLDEPGEWYQDYPTGRIFYYPKEDENMELAEVKIPVHETLLQISGTNERRISNIHIRCVNFENAAWNSPSHEGHVTLQGGFPLIDAYKLTIPGLPEKAELENQAWIKRPKRAIDVSHANNIIFEDCEFSHIGATAVDFRDDVSSSIIKSCRFSDIGGTAILVGSFPDNGFETHLPYVQKDEHKLCNEITVDNNLIIDVANEDWGAVGIGAGYVSNIIITHNEVGYVNYSGICVGWGWTPLKSGMEKNRIENNYVHHFARQLYDVGGIYTLSNQPGSTITGNRIDNLIDAPYATNNRAFYIYLDEATNGYTIENNWCPDSRFDSNRPGENNRWGVNGPDVEDSIKMNAGLRKR
jgi:hypothetical protein